MNVGEITDPCSSGSVLRVSSSSCHCRPPDKTAVAEEDTDALGAEKVVEVHPVPSTVAASVPLEVASGRQMAQQQDRVAVTSAPPLRPAQSTCQPSRG